MVKLHRFLSELVGLLKTAFLLLCGTLRLKPAALGSSHNAAHLSFGEFHSLDLGRSSVRHNQDDLSAIGRSQPAGPGLLSEPNFATLSLIKVSGRCGSLSTMNAELWTDLRDGQAVQCEHLASTVTLAKAR